MRINLLYIIFLLLLPYLFYAQSSDLKSKTYAVVVGISDYQSEDIPDLKYAHKDAEAFASFLQATQPEDKTFIKLLINEEATLGKIATAFDWLWENVSDGDQVYIYFSGHGDVEKKTISQPGYLLCWDAPSRVYMSGGAFPIPLLQDVISTLSLHNKADLIVITDACRAGKLAGSSLLGPSITGNNLIKQFANETKLLSCQPEEFSLEGEQWGGGRGAFSFHLINGLYGKADANKDFGVSLKEIRNYLESNVTAEVAPNKQTPIITGKSTRKITEVNPSLLERLENQSNFEQFSYIESKGIEDLILSQCDENTQLILLSFKKAIANKSFIPNPKESITDTLKYAEFCFQKLIDNDSLTPLHSTLKRNYAAALQDDAQQVLNVLLKTGLTKHVLSNKDETKTFAKYPEYLQRAAELLGSDHYMYNSLQARKHFFKGKINNNLLNRRKEYLQALSYEPEMPHVFMDIVTTYDSTLLDSAVYYSQKAMDLVPSWSLPYIKMYFYYRKFNRTKALTMLNKAEAVDPNSVYVWYTKARFFSANNQLDEAEKLYKKVLASTEKGICFPCAYNSLGVLNNMRYNFEKSAIYFSEAIKLDSSFAMYWANLGMAKQNTSNYSAAIKAYKQAIKLDTSFAGFYLEFGRLYTDMEEYNNAEKMFLDALKIDSNFYEIYESLGVLYKKTGEFVKAEKQLLEALGLSANSRHVNMEMARLFCILNRKEEAYLKLDHAIKNGHNDLDMLTSDPELQCLRNDTKKWSDLLNKYNVK